MDEIDEMDDSWGAVTGVGGTARAKRADWLSGAVANRLFTGAPPPVLTVLTVLSATPANAPHQPEFVCCKKGRLVVRGLYLPAGSANRLVRRGKTEGNGNGTEGTEKVGAP